MINFDKLADISPNILSKYIVDVLCKTTVLDASPEYNLLRSVVVQYFIDLIIVTRFRADSVDVNNAHSMQHFVGDILKNIFNLK